MTKKRKPHGREEVMASVLEAASELFASKGVAGVSVRDIAARAGVNHGLIHRHFGSKEALRRQTQEKLSGEVATEVGESATFEEAVVKAWLVVQQKEAFWRVLARTLLDGEMHGDVQSQFPFVQNAVGLARKSQEKGSLMGDVDPQILVAGLLAMSLGLEVFEGYILPATGLKQDDATQTKAEILTFWQNLIKRAADSGD